MANSTADNLFEQMDYNHDGKISREEMRKWVNKERISATPYDGCCGSGRRYSPCEFDYVGYGRQWQGEQVIHTTGPEETNQYLQRHERDICLHSPETHEDVSCSSPLLREQQVSVRFLRPPTPPPPGPLIIKQVREKQQPPQPPLVIDERPPRSVTPPPLVLRERPPTPPACVPCETKVEYLPAGPTPKRSVTIHRYEAVPQRPRDVIIERWLPYGPRPERRVIIVPAPDAVTYPEPKFVIYKHGPKVADVRRKFQNLGVCPEDPCCYSNRYCGQLLDSKTLIQEARAAGVTEDLNPPSVVAYGTGNHGCSHNCNCGGYDGGSITKTFSSYGLAKDTVRGGCGCNSPSYYNDGCGCGGNYRVTFRDPLSYRYTET